MATPSLPADARERFRSLGYLALPTLLSVDAVREVRDLLDPLFDQFDELPRSIARDLGAEAQPVAGRAASAEIERPSSLAPRLRATEAFRHCQALAVQLGGPLVRYTFDHAIYKAPFNQAATPWHQDQAYTGHRRLLQTYHFWIPLQPATIDNGCMHFVPGSHAAGRMTHTTGGGGHVRRVALAADAQVEACPLPIGGVTVHSPLTLHYTGPNLTAEVRRAWILHFGPFGRLAKWHPDIVLEKVAGRLLGP